MSPDAVTSGDPSWALFLDVDGAILEIAQTPQDVVAPDSLKYLLNALCVQLGGALALMSGRHIADLDRLFDPFHFSAAGLHGSERRDASGCLTRPEVDVAVLEQARSMVALLINGRTDLLLEDKGCGLALHFRRAPKVRALARIVMETVADMVGPRFELKSGDLLYEVTPARYNEATAIAAFMAMPPFAGRTPVFVGCNEDAIGYVNAQMGVSYSVGVTATAARYRFERVADAVAWLRTVLSSMPDGIGSGTAALCFRTLQ